MNIWFLNSLYYIEGETKWLPFADNIFKDILISEKSSFFYSKLLKFIPKGVINNKPVAV